ncbi:MAG: pyruvate kinase alpha/beta domain-containing protein [Syntrophobacteraceae bacterium]|nr:pyruvate kinase alpha/beta domain-containing protein [Syntrophobacteraceae bacterium]
MTAQEIVYLDKPGPQNTAEVVRAVSKRARELGIDYIVIASTSGHTALKFQDGLQGSKCSLVCVSSHAGFAGGDKVSIDLDTKKQMENQGIQTLICSHALSGVSRSVTGRFGGVTNVEIIAHVLRLFGSDGIKVAVEVAIMAADAGLIPTDQEVVAVGGTGTGADTAVVLKAAHMNNFFDLEIREIIVKPRQRKLKAKEKIEDGR